MASGTVATTCERSTTQTCRSGTSVSARRPERAPPSSTIVPVSAMASAQPVSAPSRTSSSRALRPWSSTSSIPSGRHASGRSGGHAQPASVVLGAHRAMVSASGVGLAHGGAVVRHPLGEARDRVAARRGRGLVRRRLGASPAGTSRRAARTRARISSRASAHGVPLLAATCPGRLRRESRHQSLNVCRAPRAARASASTAAGPRRPAGRARARPRAARPRSARRLGEDARHRAPSRRARAPARRLAHDPPAQVHEDRRDVDLHRADLVAGAAQRAGPRQRRRALEAAAAAA